MIDPDKLRLRIMQEAEEKFNKMVNEEVCDFCGDEAAYKCIFHDTIYCKSCATNNNVDIKYQEGKRCRQFTYPPKNCILQVIHNKIEKEVQI